MELSAGEFESRLWYEIMKYELSGEPYNKQDYITAYKIAFIAVKHNRVGLYEQAYEIFVKEWANKKGRLNNAFCYSYIHRYGKIPKCPLIPIRCRPTNKFTPSAWNLYKTSDSQTIDICIERNYVVVKHIKIDIKFDAGYSTFIVNRACIIGELPDKVILERFPNLNEDYQIKVTRNGDLYNVECGAHTFKYNYSGILTKYPKASNSGFITYCMEKKIIAYLYYPFYPISVNIDGHKFNKPNVYEVEISSNKYDSSWIESE